MTVSREIIEGLQLQGEDEKIAYRINTANFSADPDSPSTPASVTSAKIFTVTGGGKLVYTDVTATNMTGAASISGQYITLPVIASLVDGTKYRIEVLFVLEGQTFEAYGHILGER